MFLFQTLLCKALGCKGQCFLCIHPFNDGNGRMSRLLTLLLLYRSGYIVGKYISIEKLISDTKETYYEALQQSSYNWHEGTNDYAPFVTYMLGVLVAAYRDFESRIELLTTKGLSKPDRVREIIKNHLGKITKSEIMAKCPDISQITVQRALAELERDGLLYSQRTAGRFVTDQSDRITQKRKELAMQQIRIFLSSMKEMGYTSEQTLNLIQQAVKEEHS